LAAVTSLKSHLIEQFGPSYLRASTDFADRAYVFKYYPGFDPVGMKWLVQTSIFSWPLRF